MKTFCDTYGWQHTAYSRSLAARSFRHEVLLQYRGIANCLCEQSRGIEGSVMPLLSGCQESWVEGDYYFSAMHIPLYEEAKRIVAHEVLHVAETVMTLDEWQRVSDWLVTAVR